MSVTRWTFAGPYLRIWGPKETEIRAIKTCPKEACPNHKILIYGTYCSKCGSPIKEIKVSVEYPFIINSFTEKHFKNCDMFMRAQNIEPGYEIVVPNNRTRQGGIYVDEDGEFSLPTYGTEIFKEREDWAKLIAKLTELNIKFEMKIGIVQWES
jgi:hypothetical protein